MGTQTDPGKYFSIYINPDKHSGRRCLVPGCDDETNPRYLTPWVPEAVPPAEKDNELGASTEYKPDQCHMYTPDSNVTNMSCPLGHFSRNTAKCDAWLYEDSEHTIVGEWNITCLDNQWKLSLVGTVHFAGILMGSMVFGLLADTFGRKAVFLFCILLMSVSGVAQAAAPDYVTFQLFVFINALGTAGVYPLAFILGVELVGTQKREMSGVLLNYFYAVGEAAVGLVAWLTKSWVAIQLAVSAPPAMFILYYWCIPESIRWLLAKRKNREAAKIVKMAAQVNGAVLSDRLLSAFDDDNTKQRKVEEAESIDEIQGISKTVVQICKSKKLLLRSLNLFYNWAANAFVYYGLSVNSTSLSGNKYLNFALVCLVEIPGYTLAWVAMNRWGRRKPLAASLLLCTATCLAALFVPQDMNRVVVLLFLTGKLGITSSFAILVVYTTELYPTAMRSIGVGASSTVGRVGAMLAPFAPLLGVYLPSLSLLLFASVSFIAGVLALLLPETLGARLPDTVEELVAL
ncbi:organic cation transporter protein isoform X2 [Cryptotermes secundus]|uniref:organic cation transporter protein isoform X2 n=1 Tax=Cryptotermes secundus TaxID=105785 RepID=UPI001454B9E9|nr:organic cation transporter protein isoform X2 [Cryptotermes secundus]